MAEQEKKLPEVENLEVTELEDKDLEGAAGGQFSDQIDPIGNSGCPTNVNCPC